MREDQQELKLLFTRYDRALHENVNFLRCHTLINTHGASLHVKDRKQSRQG